MTRVLCDKYDCKWNSKRGEHNPLEPGQCEANEIELACIDTSANMLECYSFWKMQREKGGENDSEVQ